MERLPADEFPILTAVQSVADERMTSVRHMYPDLMRPARLQPKFDQRV